MSPDEMLALVVPHCGDVDEGWEDRVKAGAMRLAMVQLDIGAKLAWLGVLPPRDAQRLTEIMASPDVAKFVVRPTSVEVVKTTTRAGETAAGKALVRWPSKGTYAKNGFETVETDWLNDVLPAVTRTILDDAVARGGMVLLYKLTRALERDEQYTAQDAGGNTITVTKRSDLVWVEPQWPLTDDEIRGYAVVGLHRADAARAERDGGSPPPAHQPAPRPAQQPAAPPPVAQAAPPAPPPQPGPVAILDLSRWCDQRPGMNDWAAGQGINTTAVTAPQSRELLAEWKRREDEAAASAPPPAAEPASTKDARVWVEKLRPDAAALLTALATAEGLDMAALSVEEARRVVAEGNRLVAACELADAEAAPAAPAVVETPPPAPVVEPVADVEQTALLPAEATVPVEYPAGAPDLVDDIEWPEAFTNLVAQLDGISAVPTEASSPPELVEAIRAAFSVLGTKGQKIVTGWAKGRLGADEKPAVKLPSRPKTVGEARLAAQWFVEVYEAQTRAIAETSAA